MRSWVSSLITFYFSPHQIYYQLQLILGPLMTQILSLLSWISFYNPVLNHLNLLDSFLSKYFACDSFKYYPFANLHTLAIVNILNHASVHLKMSDGFSLPSDWNWMSLSWLTKSFRVFLAHISSLIPHHSPHFTLYSAQAKISPVLKHHVLGFWTSVWFSVCLEHSVIHQFASARM